MWVGGLKEQARAWLPAHGRYPACIKLCQNLSLSFISPRMSGTLPTDLLYAGGKCHFCNYLPVHAWQVPLGISQQCSFQVKNTGTRDSAFRVLPNDIVSVSPSADKISAEETKVGSCAYTGSQGRVHTQQVSNPGFVYWGLAYRNNY